MNFNNTVIRHKTQWVVKNFKQHFDINYNKTFIIIVKFMFYKIIFIIVTHYNYELK
jgi:hypothetical protein